MTGRPVALLLALALAACQPAAEPASAPGGTTPLPDDAPVFDVGEPLAVVGGVPVGANEFRELAGRRVPADGGTELSEAERMEVLKDLIDQKALYLEARRLGYDRDPKVQRQMVQLLLRQTVFNQVKNSDFDADAVQAYFEAHRDEFDIPAKVRVRRMFFKADPVRSSDEARSLAQAARAAAGSTPDSFSVVARDKSEGPYAMRGGDAGLMTREGRPGLPPEVMEQAFALAEGQVSEPFEAGGGWNVILVEERRERVERTLEQVRGVVLRRAKAEENQKLYDETVARLRQGLEISTQDDKVKALELKSPMRIDSLRAGPPGDALRPTPALAVPPRPGDGDEGDALDVGDGDGGEE